MRKKMIILLCLALCFDWLGGVIGHRADAGERGSQVRSSGVLTSKEKAEVRPNDPAAVTVEEFFFQQVRQFEAMRMVMEQEMAKNFLPTSPMYQKMLQMHQLNAAMLQELAAATAEDTRPLSAMMDEKGDLLPKIMVVRKKYEPQIHLLQTELMPYMDAPQVMTPQFGGPMPPPGDFRGEGPGRASDPQSDHDSSGQVPEQKPQ